MCHFVIIRSCPFNFSLYKLYFHPARPCAIPVGIQSGKIKNTAMTASSSYNLFHGPFLARLHRSRTGRFMGAWVARIRNANQWLQIALGRPMKLTGIATQGRADANQWVTRYLVAFSQDNMHFEYYMEYGNFKVSRWSLAMTLKYSHHQDFSVSN